MKPLNTVQFGGWLGVVVLLVSVEHVISLPFISTWMVVRWLRDQSPISQSIWTAVWGVALTTITGSHGLVSAAVLYLCWGVYARLDVGPLNRWKTGIVVALSLIPIWWGWSLPVGAILVAHAGFAAGVALLVARRASWQFLRSQTVTLGAS